MSTHAIASPRRGNLSRHEVRRVGLAEPFRWIAAGVRDFRRAPGRSLVYGSLFTIACWATYGLTVSLPWFTLAFVTGLLLAGPYLATGLYVGARQMESGGSASIREAWEALVARRTNLALFALFLALLVAAWVRLSALLFAIKFDLFSPSIDGYLGVLSGQGDPAVLTYFVAVGLLLAVAVFVTSAVAVPAIVDRDTNPLAAISASARAVAHNWPAMLLWAAIVVALTAVGIATLFVAFLVLFPVLGYATWHSYRAMLR